MNPQRHTDIFRITSGALGPIPKCELAIKPLTVFVGRQGTGKSLAAQVLYFFEELPYLITFLGATEREPSSVPSDAMVRQLLDQLRSHERAFATFASPRVRIEWTRSAPFDIAGLPHKASFAFTADRRNRVITPDRRLREFVDAIRGSITEPRRRAVFIPTERLVITQLRSSIAAKVLSLPITYTLFADWMDLASRVAPAHAPADREPAQWIARRGAEALGGRAQRRGEQWKWRYGERSGQVFDLDMASSGQRANWSIVYLAQALLASRNTRTVAPNPTVFVEEPEIHLHPAAQVAMTEILAFLVNQGIRVVMTTHSMQVIYALNNLIQASSLGEEEVNGAPHAKLRLSARDVAVYAFGDHAPRSIIDPEDGFIDERELGEVAEDLTAAMNLIAAKGAIAR